MSSLTHTTTLLHAHLKTKHHHIRSNTNTSSSPSSSNTSHHNINSNNSRRKLLVSTLLATSAAALGTKAHGPPAAQAQNWGTRSFLREHFFEPGLSPEHAVARIKQTAEGLHSIREMLDTMSWRYVIFYIRLKQAYLDQDLKTALSTLPDNLHKDYIKVANELVDNMAEVCNFKQFTFTSESDDPYIYEPY